MHESAVGKALCQEIAGNGAVIVPDFGEFNLSISGIFDISRVEALCVACKVGPMVHDFYRV